MTTLPIILITRLFLLHDTTDDAAECWYNFDFYHSTSHRAIDNVVITAVRFFSARALADKWAARNRLLLLLHISFEFWYVCRSERCHYPSFRIQIRKKTFRSARYTNSLVNSFAWYDMAKYLFSKTKKKKKWKCWKSSQRITKSEFHTTHFPSRSHSPSSTPVAHLIEMHRHFCLSSFKFN